MPRASPRNEEFGDSPETMAASTSSCSGSMPRTQNGFPRSSDGPDSVAAVPSELVPAPEPVAVDERCTGPAGAGSQAWDPLFGGPDFGVIACECAAGERCRRERFQATTPTQLRPKAMLIAREIPRSPADQCNRGALPALKRRRREATKTDEEKKENGNIRRN